jgi:hypothetical protein
MTHLQMKGKGQTGKQQLTVPDVLFELHLILLIRTPKSSTDLHIIFMTSGVCKSQYESNTFNQIPAEPKLFNT